MNDSGTWAWACEQMSAGRKVRRKSWFFNYFIRLKVNDLVNESGDFAHVFRIWFSSTDWELYEEPASEPDANPWIPFADRLPGTEVRRIEVDYGPGTNVTRFALKKARRWEVELSPMNEHWLSELIEDYKRWRPLPDGPQPDESGRYQMSDVRPKHGQRVVLYNERTGAKMLCCKFGAVVDKGWSHWKPADDPLADAYEQHTGPRPDANGWFTRDVELPETDDWIEIRCNWTGKPVQIERANRVGNVSYTHWRRLVGPVEVE